MDGKVKERKWKKSSCFWRVSTPKESLLNNGRGHEKWLLNHSFLPLQRLWFTVTSISFSPTDVTFKARPIFSLSLPGGYIPRVEKERECCPHQQWLSRELFLYPLLMIRAWLWGWIPCVQRYKSLGNPSIWPVTVTHFLSLSWWVTVITAAGINLSFIG